MAASLVNIPQSLKIVQLTLGPVTTNGGVTTDVVSLKNVVKAWLVFHLKQAVGHATAITPRQATDVAAGTNAVIPAVPIFADEDVAASDALVVKTAAANYSVAADVKAKVVLFEIDPAVLTAGYPCIYATVGDSSQATNFVLAEALLEMTYQQATPPTAITD